MDKSSCIPPVNTKDHNPQVNTKDHNPPVNTKDHNPPVNIKDHNPPVNTKDHNPPVNTKDHKLVGDLMKFSLHLYSLILYWNTFLYKPKDRTVVRWQESLWQRGAPRSSTWQYPNSKHWSMRHPSSNNCHSWLRHSSPTTDSLFFVGVQMAVCL